MPETNIESLSQASTSASSSDIILLQPLDLPQCEYAELIGGQVYFIHNGRLGMIADPLADSATAAVPCATNMHAEFLFEYGGLPAIITTVEGKKRVCQLKNERMETIAGWPGDIPACYATAGNGDVFLLRYGSRENSSALHLLTAGGKIQEIKPATAYDGIKSLAIGEGNLLLGLARPERLASCPLAAIAADAAGGAVAIQPEVAIVGGFNVFNMLAAHGNLLNAPDGPTVLRDNKGETVFSDLEKGTSGYQIDALALLRLKKDWFVLGTWRRNEEHPKNCLYILDDQFKRLLRLPDNPPGALKPWTGYNLRKRGAAGQRLLFANNAGQPVLISGYRDFAAFAKSCQNKNIEILLISPELSVFRSKPAKNAHETDGLAEARRFTAAANSHMAAQYATPRRPSTVYVTIDVEQHMKGAPYCLTGGDLQPACGLSFIMDTLEKHGLKGVFFMNIYEHPHHEDLWPRLLGEMNERGHEIGLHCHKGPLDFDTEPLSHMAAEKQMVAIKYGINYIKKHAGVAPVSYRGGGYDLSRKTLDSLAACGIKIDSSVFLATEQAMRYRSVNSPCQYGDILEIPVTTHLLSGQPSKLDINWSGSAETLRHQLLSCRNYGLLHIVTMLHSFSFLQFTRDKKEAINGFQFTGGRWIKGVNKGLMCEFEKFCAILAGEPSFRNSTFRDALESGALAEKEWGPDAIPRLKRTKQHDRLCLVCGSAVNFLPYRNRQDALCPVCNSLERMRFKMLYLKKTLQIANCAPLKILHIGPARCVKEFLESVPQHEYITADPYSPADFKFPMENIPFADQSFDLILCIGVLMHMLDDIKGVAEAWRTLRPGGRLLLWVGSLTKEKTVEMYNREDFPKMRPYVIERPEDVNQVRTEEKDGVIYYNPRCATRRYGKDFIDILVNIGFHVKLLRPAIYGDPALYGINDDDLLLECVKANGQEKKEGADLLEQVCNETNSWLLSLDNPQKLHGPL